jgi:macrodomain Ter protein organizer (MatP/YcbG family)
MGRINKSTQGIEDKIKPLTLNVSSNLWNKFKIVSASKQMTLNDYIVFLIEKEVASKAEALEALEDI